VGTIEGRRGCNHEDESIGMSEGDDTQQPTYSAEKVRQGEIILRTRARRVIFIAGLVGLVILALVMEFALR
jgi:hypothetical protein